MSEKLTNFAYGEVEWNAIFSLFKWEGREDFLDLRSSYKKIFENIAWIYIRNFHVENEDTLKFQRDKSRKEPDWDRLERERDRLLRVLSEENYQDNVLIKALKRISSPTKSEINQEEMWFLNSKLSPHHNEKVARRVYLEQCLNVLVNIGEFSKIKKLDGFWLDVLMELSSPVLFSKDTFKSKDGDSGRERLRKELAKIRSEGFTHYDHSEFLVAVDAAHRRQAIEAKRRRKNAMK